MIIQKLYLSNLSKKLILNILLVLSLGYFVYHSIYGNKGVLAYIKVSGQLEKAYNELRGQRAERVELEHNVELLRSESLDRDMLDEQVRRVLGVASPKEQVFVGSK